MSQSNRTPDQEHNIEVFRQAIELGFNQGNLEALDGGFPSAPLGWRSSLALQPRQASGWERSSNGVNSPLAADPIARLRSSMASGF